MLNKETKQEIPDYIFKDKDLSIKFPKDISENLKKDNRKFYIFFNNHRSISYTYIRHWLKELIIFIS